MKNVNSIPSSILAAQRKNTGSVYNSVPRQKHFTTKLNGSINCTRWNPTYGKYLMVASMNSSLSFWDIFSSEGCVATLDLHSRMAVIDCQWNVDGSKFISGGNDHFVKVSDFTTGKEIQSLQHEAPISCLKFHPADHNIFVACQNEKEIWTWDIRTREKIRVFDNPYGRITSVEFINGGEHLVTCTMVLRNRNIIDKGLIVRDFVTTGDISNQVSNDIYDYYDIKMHPSGEYFLAQDISGYISSFGTKSPFKRLKKKFGQHNLEGYPIKFEISPDGSIISSGDSSGDVHFYNWASSKEILKLKAHNSPCTSVSYHPIIPSAIATSSWSGEITVWI